MKKVLLTGGSGFIGANLARRLLADGHEVHLLLRRDFAEWRLRDIWEHVTLQVLDPARGDEVERVLRQVKPAWVFHLATHGAYSWQTDTAEIARTNYLYTTVLAQACVETGVEIMIHAGSSSEYGLKDHAPGEDESTEPNSVYAHTKAAATQLCRFLARTHGIPIPTMRLYSIYGPFEDPRRLMPTLVTHALDKRLPPLVAPETARDFVHVDDAIDAMLALVQKPPADPGAIYNVGSGTQTSLRDLVTLATEVFGIREQPNWSSMPARAWDTHAWVANTAKIESELGWRPSIDLRRGLAALADWLQAEPKRLEFYRQQVAASAG